MIKTLTIGTRDSKLALIQSHWVRDRLLKTYPNLEIKIIEIKTQGDKILDTALSKIGDKGLFTKELETELLAGTIDLAVHSIKDLPTKLPMGLELAAITEREDVRDVLCIAKHALERGLDDITKLKKIASSSLRRVAQIKNLYPQIKFVDMRGNLLTRFAKLDDKNNNIDALILAAAGVKRLGLESRINQYLNPEEILPAVGQGALGIEIKSNKPELKNFLRQALNSEIDEKIILIERAFLRELEGGCQIPIGIYSKEKTGQLVLNGIVASLDGKKIINGFISGSINEAETLGTKLALNLIEMGAKEILEGIRA